MILSKKQFDVLVALEEANAPLSQRLLERATGYSLGTVNRLLKELVDAGFAKNGAITAEGREALEPFRVKRAVVIAAGFGSRMVPITLNTPKPLVRVFGKRIIDSLLDACVAAGIEEIYVVRGYLAEQFDQLLYRYPTLKLIDNNDYNEANNISSVMCARHLLRNAYVCEADLLVRNPAVIRKYQYQSNILGIPRERTDDWCFEVRDGKIVEQKIGGLQCYQEIGITYLDEKDGARMEKDIGEAYDLPGGKERYWDQVMFVTHRKNYRIAIRECKPDDVVEIDSFKELKAIDQSYDV